MTTLSSANGMSPKHVLDKLQKLRVRKDLKMVLPTETCQAVGTHLAGMFLISNIDYFIELVKANQCQHHFDRDGDLGKPCCIKCGKRE
jgi:hypothetical protein